MKRRVLFKNLTVFMMLLLVMSLVVAAASTQYNTKKLGWWKLQFSSKGNFDNKIPEHERKRLVAEIAPYFNITEPFYYSYPHEVLHRSPPLTADERVLRDCMVTMLNYAYDVVYNLAERQDLNTLC